MEKSCYISLKYGSSSDNIDSEVLLLSYSGVCRRRAMYFHMQAFKDVDIIVCPTTAWVSVYCMKGHVFSMTDSYDYKIIVYASMCRFVWGYTTSSAWLLVWLQSAFVHFWTTFKHLWAGDEDLLAGELIIRFYAARQHHWFHLSH